MKLFDKVKNFFFDEEEIEEEEEEKETPIKIHSKKENKPEEITERELFKAERTFNFPMDVDDNSFEEEQIPIRSIKKEKIQINKNVSENTYRSNNSSYNNYSNFKTYTKTIEKKEEKKFKPTPIISPIYGVLDKNYKKEDLAIDATREFEMPKKLDYDTVRKKAYGNIYNNENNDKEETKGIFFNLDEEKSEEFNDNNDEVKIIYNDVSFDENEEEEKITPTVEIISKKSDDDDILSETKEEDLFNLIDNMYNSDEDDEGDDE